MKRDIAAVTATAVAVIIMVVAMVAMCVGPASAAEEYNPVEDAEKRISEAQAICDKAVKAASERDFSTLLAMFQPYAGDDRASLAVVTMPPVPGQAEKLAKIDRKLHRVSLSGTNYMGFEGNACYCGVQLNDDRKWHVNEVTVKRVVDITGIADSAVRHLANPE